MWISCCFLFFPFLNVEAAGCQHYGIQSNLDRIAATVHPDDEITQMLKSERANERMSAAHKIVDRKARKYLRSVTKLLDDPSQNVRGWAAWALGEIGDPRSIGPLIRVLAKYKKISETDCGFQESRCLPDFYLALEKLTGKTFRLDVSKWQKSWLSENWEVILDDPPVELLFANTQRLLDTDSFALVESSNSCYRLPPRR